MLAEEEGEGGVKSEAAGQRSRSETSQRSIRFQRRAPDLNSPSRVSDFPSRIVHAILPSCAPDLSYLRLFCHCAIDSWLLLCSSTFYCLLGGRLSPHINLSLNLVAASRLYTSVHTRTMLEEDMDVSLKVIIVGNGEVGKTSLITRFAKGVMTDSYKKTIGTDFMEKEITVRRTGETVRLLLWVSDDQKT